MDFLLKIAIPFSICLFSCENNSNTPIDFNDFSFEQKSSKGNWSSQDKENARNWLQSEFSKEGIENLEIEWVKETLECLMRRMETHYENLEEAQFDPEGVGNLGGECGWKYLSDAIIKKEPENQIEEEDENYEGFESNDDY